MRAGDGGDSASFTSIFLASGFSCSQAESQPAPPLLTQTVMCRQKRKNWMEKNKVSWRNVVAYCVLAYGLFWIPFFGTTYSEQIAGEAGIWGVVFGVLGPFSPLLAALIVRLVIAREDFKDTHLGLKVKWQYWAIAIILPFFWNGVQDTLQLVFGFAVMNWDHFLEGLYRVPINLFGGVLIFIGEEFGWRSYLLEKLRPIGRWKALLISGVIWSFWHTPLVMIPNANYGEKLDLLGAISALSIFVLAGFIFGWLYLESGSVWPCVLMHSYNNLIGLKLFSEAWHMNTEPSLLQNTLMAIVPIFVVWLILYFRKGYEDDPADSLVLVST
jgi:membrane protease YdiL (CAAX protease family)